MPFGYLIQNIGLYKKGYPFSQYKNLILLSLLLGNMTTYLMRHRLKPFTLHVSTAIYYFQFKTHEQTRSAFIIQQTQFRLICI